MTIQRLILLQFFVLFIIGPPIALLSNTNGFYYNYLIRGREIDYVYIAYCWMLYAFVVLISLYQISGIKNLATVYIKKRFIYHKHRYYLKLWLLSMVIASCLSMILFTQNGFSHPLFSSSINISAHEFALKRIQTYNAINMNIYNLGLHIFVSFALTIALFF